MNGRKTGVVSDLIFIDGEKYAEVSHLIYTTDKKRRRKMSWGFVSEMKDLTDNNKIDIDIHLNVPEDKIQLEAEYDNEFMASMLLDKQLIDVDGLRIVRVNDLILGKVDNRFCIVAVDVGARGLARRMGISKFFPFLLKKAKEHVIPWEYVEPLHSGLSDLRVKIQRSKVANLRPEDIADLIEDLNYKERVLIFNSLDSQKAADTLIETEPEIQKSVVSNMKSKRVIELLESMPANEAAEVLQMLPAHKSTELISMMSPENAEAVKKLFQYSSDVAGGLMSTKFITIPASFTAEQTINRLRQLAISSRDVYYLYVSDDEGKLMGVLSLRDLIISPPERKVPEFMIVDAIKVTVETPKEEIYKAMNKYNLMALPVIDLKGKLVGVIFADDVISMMLPDSLRKQRVKIRGQYKKRRRYERPDRRTHQNGFSRDSSSKPEKQNINQPAH